MKVTIVDYKDTLVNITMDMPLLRNQKRTHKISFLRSKIISKHSSNSKEYQKKKSKQRNRYKHIPHHEKPPQIVAKRNARERNRVHAVNQAFLRLRKALPVLKNKVTCCTHLMMFNISNYL